MSFMSERSWNPQGWRVMAATVCGIGGAMGLMAIRFAIDDAMRPAGAFLSGSDVSTLDTIPLISGIFAGGAFCAAVCLRLFDLILRQAPALGNRGQTIANWVLVISAPIALLSVLVDRPFWVVDAGIVQTAPLTRQTTLAPWSTVTTFTTKCIWYVPSGREGGDPSRWEQTFGVVLASGKKLDLGMAGDPALGPSMFTRLARDVRGLPIKFDDTERDARCPIRDFRAHLEHPAPTHTVDATKF